MHTLDIFKENNIDYSWGTIFVGRRLQFLKFEEVSRYATEYLMDNQDCKASYVAELAYGVPDNQVDDILKKALSDIKYEVINKDGPVWNLEKRKWRYCILKFYLKEINNNDILLKKIDEVYSDFGYPIDMVNFIHYRPEAGFFHLVGCGKDDINIYIKNLINRFEDFLFEEKLKIDNKVFDWPDSIIYYPEAE